MSLINAISMANYTVMANNAAFRGMAANNARLGLISGAGPNFGFNSMRDLADADTQLELDALTCGLQYKIANAMLDSLKARQDEDIKRSFSTFA